MSVRPRVSNAASVPASKSALCNRMVAGIASAPRHWRKERNFFGARDRRTSLDMGVIDGGTDDLGVPKCERIPLATPGTPSHEICDSSDAGRRTHNFLALADALAHTGEI